MSVSGLIYDSIEIILYICFRFKLWFYRDHSVYVIQVLLHNRLAYQAKFHMEPQWDGEKKVC